jgi:rRNA maturation endonuclease Nob1
MTEYIKCETCLYNKNCQFLAKHRNAIVEGCSAYKNAADMVEVVHGRWIKRQFADEPTAFGYRCSECHLTYDFDTNYCPNCGADMRKIEKR